MARKVELHPTPDIVAAAYEYLRACPPCNRWGLPSAEEVEFHITRSKDERGHFRDWKSHYEIGVSMHNIGTTDALIRAVAHEMCHARQSMLGDKTIHGAVFLRLAASVCRHHGFDPKLF